MGSKVCAQCHLSIYRKYIHTDMAHSMVQPLQCPELEKLSTAITVFDTKLNQYFQVFRRGQDFYQSEYALGADGREVFRHTEKIAYVMGAGENGIGFLVQRGNYLFQAPLAFYAKTQTWGLSPGYESHDFGFSRPITAVCIVCHSGLAQPVPNRKGLYKSPPFRELGIGCENCHGPGQLHVEARFKGKPLTGKTDYTIVNPAQLSPWLADNICMSCHEEGDARVLQPGKNYVDFRPGTPLNDTVAVFSLPLNPQSDRQLPLLGYYSEMELSRCFQGSHGRLSCLTCHNPHQQLTEQAAVAHYRSKCLTCHTDESCGVPLLARLHEKVPDDCVGCHMPKQEAQLFSHTAVTNHRIMARQGEPLPASTSLSTPSQLIYLDERGGNSHVSPLLLLNTYRQILLSHPAPEYEERYSQMLAEAEKTNPNSIVVLRALAKVSSQQGTLQGRKDAIHDLERIVAMKSATPDDRFALGEMLAMSGQAAEGIAILEKAVPTDPYNPLGYEGLTMSYLMAGRYADAVNVIQQALKLFPENRILRIMLLKVGSGR